MSEPNVPILGDIRVLDLTIARAGPTAVRLLADWGAQVTRIEMPGDDGVVRDHDSADYINLHSNKRLLAIDLKSPEGQTTLDRLLAKTDVVVENFRTSVKERLGLSWANLSDRHPKVILASISGYGQDGPESDLGAVDQIIQGYAGLMSVTGTPETGPMRAGVAVSDLTAGILLANAILLALIDRQRRGVGQWVTVSLLEAAISLLDFQAARFLIDGELPEPVGNHHPSMTPMGTFRAADGYVNVGAPSDRLWERFCEAVERPDLLDRPEYASAQLRHENREALLGELQDVLDKRTSDAWGRRFSSVGVPWGPVNSLREVFDRPQVKHLGVTESVMHGSRGMVEVLRTPISMSAAQRSPKRAAPLESQHTDQILTELDFTAHQIEEMRAKGTI